MSRMLTHKRLVQVLSYNPETGIFIWLVNLSRKPTKGKIAGSVAADGYRVIQIDGVHYKAQRLAWFYCFKRWPKPTADHRDLDRDNNRIQNLRRATRSQNCANTGLLPTNRSGHKGVSRATPEGLRWKAQIRKDGVRHHLGYFNSPEAASQAYAIAAMEMHGEFARLK